MNPTTSSVSPNYIGLLRENTSLETFFRSDQSNTSIPVTNLFIARYHAYPCTVLIEGSIFSPKLHVSSLRRYIEIDRKHNPADDIVRRQYHQTKRTFYITDFLSDLGNGIMIDCENCQLNNNVENSGNYAPDGSDNHFLLVDKVRVNYLPQHEVFVFGELATQLASFYMVEIKPTIPQMVCRNQQRGYYLSGINIQKPLIQDLSRHYGKKFVNVHYQIIQALSKKEWKGVVLLYDIPGTGKCHYIQYLINEIQDRNILLISSDITRDVLSPEFVQFLKQYSDAIVIIENAENITIDHSNQAVKYLFDLSDMIHRPIVATFNDNLHHVLLCDKNRSIIQYGFDQLDEDNARILKTDDEESESITSSLSTEKLKTPDEVVQSIAAQELAPSNNDNCIIS